MSVDRNAGASAGPCRWTPPIRDGVRAFDVTLDAEDLEAALERVWDAVATSGTDDHIVFLEHPNLPEHWRLRSGRPAEG